MKKTISSTIFGNNGLPNVPVYKIHWPKESVLKNKNGPHYATPTVENATDKTYPIVRPLYYYYNVRNKDKFHPWFSLFFRPTGRTL